MQGNGCQNWVDREFEKIKKCVDTCLKGNNPKLNIDNSIRKMSLTKIPTRNDSDETSDSQTYLKTVNDSNITDTNMDNTAELESDTVLKCINTEDNAGKKISALEVKSTPNDTDKPSEVLEQSKFTQQLISVFHSLENKLIECNNEYSKKIDGMNSVIEV